ncbi:MAG: exodeoxyribonuclease VII small subunit [Proteobacteria bacterium]|nr:exodeoxyribonuclease VII small subunit [Pseudomonadota bacterium]
MAAKPETIPDDIRKMAFEEALAALEQIVGKLESGEVSLEESIDIYTRGTYLKRHCQEKLKDAQARIEKITISDSGEPTGTEPFGEE